VCRSSPIINKVMLLSYQSELLYSGYVSGSGDLNLPLLTHYLVHQFSLRNGLMIHYSIKGENVALISR
jgi:hypothetical protein